MFIIHHIAIIYIIGHSIYYVIIDLFGGYYIMKFNPLKIGDLSVPLPIIQGGMGIGVSLSNLASAVTNAGGIGVISAAQIGFRDKNFENNALDCN